MRRSRTIAAREVPVEELGTRVLSDLQQEVGAARNLHTPAADDGGAVKQSTALYRVNAAVVAVNQPGTDGQSDCRRRFVTIPRDSVIEVQEPLSNFGLVDITWQGQSFSVFMRDIEDYTERISRTAPANNASSARI